ncbi:hypothetical protein [Anaerotignum sp.]
MMCSAFNTTADGFEVLLISVIILVIRILGEKKNSANCHVQNKKPLYREPA